MKNKKGISLVVLTITIIVMVILASTVIFYINDTMLNSNKAAFALDLKNVEDLSYEYYLNNNELPKAKDLNSGTDIEYDKNKLIGLVDEVRKDDLSNEIATNKDDDETFYVIDLDKLPIESTNRGLKLNGDTDCYVITKESMNVYYLRGEKIRNKYYFSLTKDIVEKTELETDKTQDGSIINITNVTSSIQYKKSTNDWTKDLTIEIKTEVGEETLKYTLAGIDISASVTTKNINVSEIVSNSEEVKTAFYAPQGEKTLKVQKIKNEVVIAETNIDVSNLDMLSGNTITQSNVKHQKYDTFILASIADYNDLGGSGLKEVRVLYTTKSDGEGNNVPYGNLPNDITKEYISLSGIRNTGLLLKLPLDVTGYSLVFVDNAGNISDICTITVSY